MRLFGRKPKVMPLPPCPGCGKRSWVVTWAGMAAARWPALGETRDTRRLRCATCGYRVKVQFYEKGEAGWRKPEGWYIC